MKKKVLRMVAMAAAIAVLAAGCGKNNQQTEPAPEISVAEPEKQVTIDKNAIEEKELEGSQTLVFFGVDTRGTSLGKGTRSDSIMVVNVDHDAKEVRVASIYRDTMLNLGDYGYEKITHAHSYGGPEFAMERINENLDLQIEDYVTVNFITMADIIDRIGGVTMEITSAEASSINGSIQEINKLRGTNSAQIHEAGTYLLDGTQAVAYSRIRSTSGGDYKRSERQREVLFKLFETVKSMDTETRIEVAEDMIDLMNTSLYSNEVTDLMICLSKYEIAEMTAYPQVFYGGTVEGAWVEVPTTLVDMAEGMHKFLYDETDYTPSETVESYSATLSNKVSGPNHDMREEEDTAVEGTDNTEDGQNE